MAPCVDRGRAPLRKGRCYRKQQLEIWLGEPANVAETIAVGTAHRWRAGRRVSQSCVCYKFLGLLKFDEQCLSINFPARKINCKLVLLRSPLAGNREPSSGCTTTPDKIKMQNCFAGDETDRTLFFSSISLPVDWEPCADSRRASIYIQCPARFSTKRAAN